jgi:hypothetical protein
MPIPIRVAREPGRNARCPCGSGRKYKQCHLLRERIDFAARKLARELSEKLMATGPGRAVGCDLNL